MRGLDAAIVPLGLDGLWGSVFSFSKQRVFWKLPERPRGVVSVTFGQPLPATATASEVREAVAALVGGAAALGEAQPVALPLRRAVE
jgi:acyl-[acyl-carrier-protein]-phospholipid O-acyltransferase/long-chain-fatty-acid--[acyl-carrier-protein] ligase